MVAFLKQNRELLKNFGLLATGTTGKHPHEPDVQMLMRLCDVHDVPLAAN